jgi:hypothetical protein
VVHRSFESDRKPYTKASVGFPEQLVQYSAAKPAGNRLRGCQAEGPISMPDVEEVGILPRL